jgi:hypothetical protein
MRASLASVALKPSNPGRNFDRGDGMPYDLREPDGQRVNIVLDHCRSAGGVFWCPRLQIVPRPFHFPCCFWLERLFSSEDRPVS